MDQTLPASGKDTQITLSIDGALVNVIDQVTSFSARAVYDDVEHKPLGTSEVYIDKEPTGWEGDLELAASRRTVDEFMDQVHAAARARVPTVVSIRETTHYRNGTSKTYVYPNVKIGIESRSRRSEARSITLSWRTGIDRYAL